MQDPLARGARSVQIRWFPMSASPSPESGGPPVRPMARMLGLSLLAGAGIALVLAVAFGLKFGTGKENPSLLFPGRFHPLVVHLPIALLLVAFLFEYAGTLRPFRHLRDSVPALLLLAALGAALAVVHGCLLAAGGGDFPTAVQHHLWAGVTVAVGAFLLPPLRVAAFGFGNLLWKSLYHILLVGTVLVLAGAAHLGGNLTHGSDYLVKHMPSGLRPALAVLPGPMRQFLDLPATPAPAVAAAAEATIHSNLLAPAFDKHCVSCHNENKARGGLRLDNLAGLMKGGEAGPAVTPGKPQESQLLRRISLPPDDDDFMPPAGKPALSGDQVAAIRWWIESGKPAETPVSAVKDAPPSVMAILTAAVSAPAVPAAQ